MKVEKADRLTDGDFRRHLGFRGFQGRSVPNDSYGYTDEDNE